VLGLRFVLALPTKVLASPSMPPRRAGAGEGWRPVGRTLQPATACAAGRAVFGTTAADHVNQPGFNFAALSRRRN